MELFTQASWSYNSFCLTHGFREAANIGSLFYAFIFYLAVNEKI
jgi:hypothetical protein